jgi:hypothetical protein
MALNVVVGPMTGCAVFLPKHPRGDALDPGHLETEALSAADIESVARDEQHLLGPDAQFFFSQFINACVLLEGFGGVHADCLFEIAVKPGVRHQRRQNTMNMAVKFIPAIGRLSPCFFGFAVK